MKFKEITENIKKNNFIIGDIRKVGNTQYEIIDIVGSSLAVSMDDIRQYWIGSACYDDKLIRRR